MTLVAFLAALVGLALAAFFLSYGTKAGILERRILADFHGHYETGRSALLRGIFYVMLGLLFLAGSVLTLAVVIPKIKS